MRKHKNVYQKYLFRLGVILLILYVPQFVYLLAKGGSGLSVLPAIAGGLLAICRSRSDRFKAWLPLGALALVLIQAFSLLLRRETLDSLVNAALFLLGLIFYLLLLEVSQERKWNLVQRRPKQTLDLRIHGKEALFGPMVMAPHLEINGDITAAVDRFLETADRTLPLHICVHCSARISEPLQETVREVFRAHYEDEELKINHFLESRFGRAIWLIIISISALQLINLAVGGEVSGVVWTIVSNFAAFSLWQIGSTFFERSDAMRVLIRARIAEYAEITFE